MNDPTPQPELPLPFPELAGDQPLIPARMVNEYQYCPRLAYLEWVQGEWAESADTVEGRHRHRRVDRKQEDMPLPEEGEEFAARSVTLSSNRLGLIAKMDVIESDGEAVIPVDYKRGKRPHVPKGAYDPERVQLCVQGLILREHGYCCDEAALYYVASKERVRVVLDDDLIELTMAAVHGLRLVAAGGQMPPPLVDSPKCPRCSLVGICLPDEMHFLRDGNELPRPLAVNQHEALPLYIQNYKAKLAKRGEELVISERDQILASARLPEVSQVALMGNVYVTTPCLTALMQRGISVTWMSYGGWLYGHTVGMTHKNVELRTAQYRASFDSQRCLQIARGLVVAKISNARVLLRRNWKGEAKPSDALQHLSQAIKAAKRAQSLEQLLGIEGNAAAIYFKNFRGMLKTEQSKPWHTFDFLKRNRRPPSDPVNAMLSFAYALLVRSLTTALQAVGFDPLRGLYHQPRYGRPALALDLMEPFRPLLADSVVIQVINNGEVRPGDFVSAAGSVNLDTEGRKRFIGAFERRLSTDVTHPLFGYRISYRRLLELQARLLGRHLLGELPEYPNFVTR